MPARMVEYEGKVIGLEDNEDNWVEQYTELIQDARPSRNALRALIVDLQYLDKNWED